MPTIKEVLMQKQPEIYCRLIAANVKTKQQKPRISFQEAEKLMRHDAYTRGPGGALRQVKHLWH